MTTKRDPLDLAAIEARCAAATDGPWGLRRYDANYPGDRYEVVVELRGAEWTLEQRRANAELMAHARADIPALLAEVRRLQADNERMRRGLEMAKCAVYGLRAPSDEEWDEGGDDPTGMVRHIEARILPGLDNLLAGREWKDGE